ncbi:hypothetical protein D7Z26_07655 [Cohnella endophytica]|uniref:DUF1232 domain-containing protein n=1 Tax=Cohnella endophytica TaxID=2419778 RepID=A0A494Y162_9BACL|nr:hypothetical protein [Cohnella endophytica]RKP55093.1 hypothetical protein D7Z26_07655 [Cohnella endophytica]
MARKSWTLLWRRLPVRVWRILRSDRVSLRDKLLLIVPVGLYWVLPDFMPFVPIDDAAFTVIAAGWFARSMERKYRLGDRKQDIA